jgi:hypothetical protein
MSWLFQCALLARKNLFAFVFNVSETVNVTLLDLTVGSTNKRTKRFNCERGGLIRNRMCSENYPMSSSALEADYHGLNTWSPPKNPAEYLGGFSTIFFFTG